MALMPSPELLSFLNALGLQWPEANEDALRDVAGLYTDASKQLAGLTAHFQDVAAEISKEFAGETATRFLELVNELCTGDPPYLDAAADQALQLAQVASDTATSVEYTKWMIIAELIALFIQIVAMMLLMEAVPFLGPFLAPQITWEMFVGEQTIMQIIRALIVDIAQQVALGTGLNAFMSVAVQTLQILGHHRTGLDGDLIGQGALTGAIGGAIAAPFDFVAAGLGKALGDSLGKVLSKAPVIFKAGVRDSAFSIDHGLVGTLKESLGLTTAKDVAGASAKDIVQPLVNDGATTLATTTLAGSTKKGLSRLADDVGAALSRRHTSFSTEFVNGAAAPLSSRLGGLGKDFTRAIDRNLDAPGFGAAYAEALSRHWALDGASQQLVRGEIGKVVKAYEGVLGKDGADFFANALPKAVYEWAQRPAFDSFRYKFANVLAGSFTDGVNQGLSGGAASAYYGEGFSFTFGAFVGGAATGLVARGFTDFALMPALKGLGHFKSPELIPYDTALNSADALDGALPPYVSAPEPPLPPAESTEPAGLAQGEPVESVVPVVPVVSTESTENTPVPPAPQNAAGAVPVTGKRGDLPPGSQRTTSSSTPVDTASKPVGPGAKATTESKGQQLAPEEPVKVPTESAPEQSGEQVELGSGQAEVQTQAEVHDLPQDQRHQDQHHGQEQDQQQDTKGKGKAEEPPSEQEILSTAAATDDRHEVLPSETLADTVPLAADEAFAEMKISRAGLDVAAEALGVTLPLAKDVRPEFQAALLEVARGMTTYDLAGFPEAQNVGRQTAEDVLAASGLPELRYFDLAVETMRAREPVALGEDRVALRRSRRNAVLVQLATELAASPGSTGRASEIVAEIWTRESFPMEAGLLGGTPTESVDLGETHAFDQESLGLAHEELGKWRAAEPTDGESFAEAKESVASELAAWFSGPGSSKSLEPLVRELFEKRGVDVVRLESEDFSLGPGTHTVSQASGAAGNDHEATSETAPEPTPETTWETTPEPTSEPIPETASEPTPTPPYGFAVPHEGGGKAEFPFGTRTQAHTFTVGTRESASVTDLSDPEGFADLVAGVYQPPPGSPSKEILKALARMSAQNSTARLRTQRMLEEGLVLSVPAKGGKGQPWETTVSLRNVRRDRATRIAARDTGKKVVDSYGASPDPTIQQNASQAYSHSNSNTLDLSAMTTVAAKVVGGAVVAPVAGAGVGSSKSDNHSVGVSSSGRDQVKYGAAMEAFDFFDVELVVETRRGTQRYEAHRAKGVLSLSFPSELTKLTGSAQESGWELSLGAHPDSAKQDALAGLLADTFHHAVQMDGLSEVRADLLAKLRHSPGTTRAHLAAWVDARYSELGMLWHYGNMLRDLVPDLVPNDGSTPPDQVESRLRPVSVAHLGRAGQLPVEHNNAFTNSKSFGEGVEGSMSASLGISVGPPTGSFGPHLAANVVATFGIGNSAGHAVNYSTSGGGEHIVRYTEPVVLYVVHHRIEAGTVFSGVTRNLVDRSVSTVIAVPEPLAETFERHLRQLLTDSAPASHAPEPDPAQTSPPPPAQTRPDPTSLHPPAVLSQEKGDQGLLIGYEHLESRAFSSKLRTLFFHDAHGMDLAAWTSEQQVAARQFLAAHFGSAVLNHRIPEIFGAGGMSRTFTRQLGGGDVQLITVNASGRRTGTKPVRHIAVESAYLENGPIVTTEVESTSLVNSWVGVQTAGLRVTLATGDLTAAQQPGAVFRTGVYAPPLRASGGRSSGLAVGGYYKNTVNYSGPAHQLRYAAEIELTVSVQRIDAKSFKGWLLDHTFRTQHPYPVVSERSAVIDSAVTVLVPRSLMSQTEPPAFDRVPELVDKEQKPLVLKGDWRFREKLGSLDDDYNHPVSAHDRVMDVALTGELRDELVDQLVKGGISRKLAVPLSQVWITPGVLAGALHRGGRGHNGTVVQEEIVSDRRAWMLLVPHLGASKNNGDPLPMGGRLIMEGATSRRGQSSSQKTVGIGGVLDQRFGGNNDSRSSGFLQFLRSAFASNTTAATLHSNVTEGAILGVEQMPHQHWTKDVVWQLYVAVDQVGRLGTSRSSLRQSRLLITDGVSGYSPRREEVPIGAPGTITPPEGVPRTITYDHTAATGRQHDPTKRVVSSKNDLVPLSAITESFVKAPGDTSKETLGAAVQKALDDLVGPAFARPMDPDGGVLMSVLDEVATASALQPFMNALLSTGVPLVVLHDRAGGMELGHVLLRYVRDPENHGLSFLEEFAQASSTHYTTLGTRAENTKGAGSGKNKSVMVSATDSATGEDHLPSSQQYVSGSRRSSADARQNRGLVDLVQSVVTRSGKHERYVLEGKLVLEFVPSFHMSRPLGTLLLDVPRQSTRLWKSLRSWNSVRQKVVPLLEVVQIPKSSLTVPALSQGDVVLPEVVGEPPATGAAPLVLTPKDLAAMKYLIRFVPERSGELFQSVYEALRDAAFLRAIDFVRDGQNSLNDLRVLFGAPRLLAHLLMTGTSAPLADAMVDPELFARGGPLTDTLGRMGLRFQVKKITLPVKDPRAAWELLRAEHSVYRTGVVGSVAGSSEGAGVEGGVFGTTNSDPLNPGSTHGDPTAALSHSSTVGASSSSRQQTTHDLLVEQRDDFYLTVSADVEVSLDLVGRNERGIISFGEESFAYQKVVPDLVQIQIAPEALLDGSIDIRAIATGAAGALPIPDGWFVPSGVGGNVTAEEIASLRSALKKPPEDRVTYVHVVVDDDGNILVKGRALDEATFRDEVLGELADLTEDTTFELVREARLPGVPTAGSRAVPGSAESEEAQVRDDEPAPFSATQEDVVEESVSDDEVVEEEVVEEEVVENGDALDPDLVVRTLRGS